MYCHDLIANGTATHAFEWPDSLTTHHTTPVLLGSVDARFAAAAAVAAALWNTYLHSANLKQQVFNVTAGFLPGDVVGQIWIPCADVCNVTIDPRYNAPTNVLVHEFGHGIGLPAGSVSTKYSNLKVGVGNHWEPGDIDPREIMTAILDPDPYLAKYTLDAMSGHTHKGCYYDYECPGNQLCKHHSGYYPAYCDSESSIIFDTLFFLIVLTVIFIPIIVCTATLTSQESKYDYSSRFL